MDLFSLFYEPLRRASAASSNSARLRAAGKAKAQEAEQDAAGSEVDYLDPEGGLAVCWLQAIHQRLEASSTGEYGSEGALEELDEEERLTHLLEANTWALLQSLYLQRTSPGSSGPSGSTDPSSSSSSGDSFTYTPPLTLVQNAIAKDSALGELSIVKDWLCETAYTLGTGVHPAEVRKGYQPYTKNKLKQAIRTSTSGKGKATGSELVTSLDPDATNRTDGSDSKRQVLDSEDANYEKALLRTLWEYVRVGELDQAIDMCRQSDVSWRAASLSGGKLYEDDVLARAAASAGGDMEILQSEGEERFIQGNLRRKLWKTTCRALAGSEHLDQYEKALYGAIAGEQESVLPVCRSWEDQLWVRINALLEEEIDSILLEKEQQGNYLLDEANSDAAFTPSSAAKGKGTRRDIPKAMQDIFNALLAEPTLRIDARSPFHVAQSWIILDRTNDLLDSFVSKLEASSGELDEPQLAHLLRFFAHLILFLRLISQTSAATIEPLPTASSTAILEAYIQVLEAHSQSADVIAFYCSSLEEDGAIEAYARYLFSEYTLSTNATSSTGRSSRLGERQERRQALLHAADNGLHLASVARRVVELTLADVYTELPDFDAANAAFGLLSPSGAKETGDEREQELIRSVEWLTFDAETYPDALRQANALMRYFLCAGSPLLARRITFQIPPDLLPSSAQSGTRDPSAPHADAAEDQINEYLDYTSFFSCLSLHLQYTEIWSRRPVGPQAKQSERLAFSQAIKGVTGRLWEEIVDLLTTGWLVLALPEEAALDLDVQRRQLELSRIRAAYVPELVFRLHNALLDTGREFVPSNLQRCLELSNVVADERHRLYAEFLGDGHSAKQSDNWLREYLDGVREAALCALQSSSDPFQVVEA